MASERELRKRIRSVTNIAQVTKALEAVSASRVRRAQAAVIATRPYSAKAYEILLHLAGQAGAGALLHPLLEVRPVIARSTILLITGDRGLAGAYNANMVRTALEFARTRQAELGEVRWITVGRKGRDLLWRRGGRIVAEFSRLPATPGILDVTAIARSALDEFLRGEADQVLLAYTDFVNTVTQRPGVRRLLPLVPGSGEEQAMSEYVEARRSGPAPAYIYEPSAEALLGVVLPRFTELQVYQAILESLASEHSARMVAMRNATESALDLVQDLTLARNKARQLAITSDLLDIAGGAEALKSGRARQSSEVMLEPHGREARRFGRGRARVTARAAQRIGQAEPGAAGDGAAGDGAAGDGARD
jgi:F-type H+-transporting ATPase subunit gamma